jgi:hypothetical protein
MSLEKYPGILTSYSDNTICTSHFDLPTSPFTDETPRRRDDPNSNWDDHTQTLSTAILYSMAVCCIMLFFFGASVSVTANLLKGLRIYYPLPVLALINLWGVVIFSLTIELDLSEIPLWAQRLLCVLIIGFFACGVFFSFFIELYEGHYPFTGINTYWFWISAAVFYILCAVLYRILGPAS